MSSRSFERGQEIEQEGLRGAVNLFVYAKWKMGDQREASIDLCGRFEGQSEVGANIINNAGKRQK
jgi:hypothetical protein